MPLQSPPGRLAVLVAVAVLSLGVAVLSLDPPPGPASAGALATNLTNGCSSPITNTVSPATVRICDPATVRVDTLPTCPACPGGVRVAFVLRAEVTDANWQRQQGIYALQELERLFGPRLKAAVIEYKKGSSRAMVALTDNMSSIRGAMARPHSVANPPDANGDADEAASLAVRQLQLPRGQEPTMPDCELVVFFAQDSPTPA